MGIFTGKTAIITGGGKAKSIGYGIATAYAKEGANLVLTGRNEQKLIDAKEELEKLYGVNVLAVQADVNSNQESEQSVKNVVAKAVKEFGRIDVLINNAQASASGVPLQNIRLNSLIWLYIRDYMPHFFICVSAILILKKRRGL